MKTKTPEIAWWFKQAIVSTSKDDKPEIVQIAEDEDEFDPQQAKIEMLQLTCIALIFMMASIITLWFNA